MSMSEKTKRFLINEWRSGLQNLRDAKERDAARRAARGGIEDDVAGEVGRTIFYFLAAWIVIWLICCFAV